MKISKMIVQNFRPFYGRQELNLETDPDRSIILIEALNDVGKTSLFKAIQFCLYGSRATGEKPVQNINRTACCEKDGRTYVKLSFSHDDVCYDVIRSIDFEKLQQDGGYPEISQESVMVIKEGKPEQLETLNDQNKYLEQILPKDASQFFLFDGEDIQKYTRHPIGDNVKEAIEEVLGIRELLNAREDLQSVKRDLQNELDDLLLEKSKNDKEATQANAIGNEVESLRKNIKEIEDKIEQAKANVKSCDETLRKNKSIQEKIDLRKQAEGDLNTVKEQIKTNDDNLRQLNEHLAVVLSHSLLTELSKLGRQEVPHWKKNALAVLIGSDSCICYREITEPIRDRWERQLDKDGGTSVRQYLGEQATELLINCEPGAREKEFYDALADHTNYYSSLVSIEQKIQTLNREIGASQDLTADIIGAADTRNRAAKDIENYTEEVRNKKAEVDFKAAEYRRRQQKLAQQYTDKDIDDKNAHFKAVEQCEEGMNEAIDKLVQKNKKRVNDLASEVFLKLTNAPKLYQGIDITDEYELKIKTVGGITRSVWDQNPSSGQSQMIATSFIAALNRYTAREAPVIIDTPIGRLDPIHKKHLIDFYPDLGPQVIILYQPSELNVDSIAPIQKHVASEWIFERAPQNADITLITRKGRN